VEADKKQYLIDEVKKIPDSRSWIPLIMLTEHVDDTESDVTLLLESVATLTGKVQKLEDQVKALSISHGQ